MNTSTPSASKIAVICEGVTYYISNDWFANDKPRPTKFAFVRKLIERTTLACKQQNETGTYEEEQEEISANEPDTLPTVTTTNSDDLKTLLESLNELHKKVDRLTDEVKALRELWK